MVEYTRLQTSLLQLLMIRNTIDVLIQIGNLNYPFAISVSIRYIILELDSFVDSQSSLMGNLTLEQKNLVLCLTPFLEEINTYKKAIKQIRDGWVGHPPNEGELKEDITGLMVRHNFPKSPITTQIMSKCAILYVDALKIILSEDFDMAHKKIQENRETSKVYFAPNDKDVQNILNAKRTSVQEQLQRKGFTH